MIRVYRFQRIPYILLAFLTPKIFYLEFARQRIISEELHFIRAHKTSNLKFHFTLGPFTSKNKSCVAILDSYVCQLPFLLGPKVRYNPLNTISNRNKRKTNESLEHEGMEGLERIANKEEVLEGWSFVGLISQTPRGIGESLTKVVQTPAQGTSLHKRTTSDLEAMDVDDPGSLKRIKLAKGKEIEGQVKANIDSSMKVIYINEDQPLTEFTGALIENEKINEPAGDPMGKKEQEEKAGIPPI